MKDILHDNKSIDNIMSMINMDNHECDKCMVISRRMTKIAQVKVQQPIHCSTKKPEFSKQLVTDLTPDVERTDQINLTTCT